MFLGKFNHSLDNKNRLSLPSKFVCKLPKQICISKGFDGCLEIRTPAEFQKRLNILTEKDENKKTNRDLLRIFTNNTIEVNIDKANRILISSELLKEASIIKDVVVCGSANRIEIWDVKKYQEFVNRVQPKYEELAEKDGRWLS